MTTDIETFTDMLNRAGVMGRLEESVEGKPLIVINARDGDEEKNLGYKGFVAVFEFDEEGSLLSVGVWE